MAGSCKYGDECVNSGATELAIGLGCSDLWSNDKFSVPIGQFIATVKVHACWSDGKL